MAAEQAPIPYVKPQVVARTGETAQEEQELVLEQARHPCLETMENISFIPNDANFGKDRRFCIITGPNLGGKSTYLRSAGHWPIFCFSFLSKRLDMDIRFRNRQLCKIDILQSKASDPGWEMLGRWH